MVSEMLLQKARGKVSDKELPVTGYKVLVLTSCTGLTLCNSLLGTSKLDNSVLPPAPVELHSLQRAADPPPEDAKPIRASSAQTPFAGATLPGRPPNEPPARAPAPGGQHSVLASHWPRAVQSSCRPARHKFHLLFNSSLVVPPKSSPSPPGRRTCDPHVSSFRRSFAIIATASLVSQLRACDIS